MIGQIAQQNFIIRHEKQYALWAPLMVDDLKIHPKPSALTLKLIPVNMLRLFLNLETLRRFHFYTQTDLNDACFIEFYEEF